MAKKQLSEKKESKIKILIWEYLMDEGLMRGNVKDPKLDFGFNFIFPGGVDPKGRQIGRGFTIIKPKNKDFIEIRCGTTISPEHIKKLGDKKKHFFAQLQKYLLSKSFFFQLDVKNNRYGIIDNIFLKKDGTISKNRFYKTIRKIFTSTIYSIVLLKEFCEVVIDFDEWKIK